MAGLPGGDSDMAKIGHGHGSEWHLLRYMGRHRLVLDDGVIQATGAVAVEWLDFPFSRVRKPLLDDREWKGMEFLGDEHRLETAWRSFWPQVGKAMNWDAVGRATLADGSNEWLLVEAKAHIRELEDKWKEKSPKSRQMIDKAFAETAAQTGIGGPVPADWYEPYYQYANRLAALHFLNREGEPARLLFIGFYGEEHNGWKCPQTAAEWEKIIGDVHQRLGVISPSPLLNRVHHVYLPVQP
jgi:hypothetical protein